MTQIELACLMEATARKPGNVHPGARFHDLTYAHFQDAAALIAPILADVGNRGLGATIRRAVEATRRHCQTNVNLGICLLLTPIAAVSDPSTLRQGVAAVIEDTTPGDAAEVYAAIRMAVAGGLGQVTDQDISDIPTESLLQVMQLAEDRDAIAWEWSTRFRGIDRDGAQWLRSDWQELTPQQLSRAVDSEGRPLPRWEVAIIQTHLRYLERGDTLIRRKCGDTVFAESRQRATAALAAGGCLSPEGLRQIASLDQWLRADGHRRNPGTSADLVAGSLLWALRKNWIQSPTKSELRQHAAEIQLRQKSSRAGLECHAGPDRQSRV